MNKLILTLFALTIVAKCCASDGTVTLKNGGIYTVGYDIGKPNSPDSPIQNSKYLKKIDNLGKEAFGCKADLHDQE